MALELETGSNRWSPFVLLKPHYSKDRLIKFYSNQFQRLLYLKSRVFGFLLSEQ